MLYVLATILMIIFGMTFVTSTGWLPGCAAGAGAQRLVLLAQDDEGFYWENLLSGAVAS